MAEEKEAEIPNTCQCEEEECCHIVTTFTMTTQCWDPQVAFDAFLVKLSDRIDQLPSIQAWRTMFIRHIRSDFFVGQLFRSAMTKKQKATLDTLLKQNAPLGPHLEIQRGTNINHKYEIREGDQIIITTPVISKHQFEMRDLLADFKKITQDFSLCITKQPTQQWAKDRARKRSLRQAVEDHKAKKARVQQEEERKQQVKDELVRQEARDLRHRQMTTDQQLRLRGDKDRQWHLINYPDRPFMSRALISLRQSAWVDATGKVWTPSALAAQQTLAAFPSVLNDYHGKLSTAFNQAFIRVWSVAGRSSGACKRATHLFEPVARLNLGGNIGDAFKGDILSLGICLSEKRGKFHEHRDTCQYLQLIEITEDNKVNYQAAMHTIKFIAMASITPEEWMGALS